MNRLLLAISNLVTAAAGAPAGNATLTNLANEIDRIMGSIVSPILVVIGAAGMIYAIILGVNYIKAETPDKRKEAQGRLIGAIIGVVIILAGIAICNFVDWATIASTFIS